MQFVGGEEGCFFMHVNIQIPVRNWFIELQKLILHVIYTHISIHEELKTS